MPKEAVEAPICVIEGHTGKHKPLMGSYKWMDGVIVHDAPLYKKERTSNRGTYYYLYRHSQSGKWLITHKGAVFVSWIPTYHC